MTLGELHRSAAIRTTFLVSVYTLALSFSWWLAHELRFDFDITPDYRLSLVKYWFAVVAFKILVLYAFGQFAGLLSYFSIPDLRRLFYSSLVSSGTLLLAYYATSLRVAPRGVLLTDFLISFTSLSVIRLAFRLIREGYLSPESGSSRRARRVGIVGAGDVGASLAHDLMAKRGLGLQPVAFFDEVLHFFERQEKTTA